MSVTPSSLDTLARLLDIADLRHRVISENVANVNTPAYRARKVMFEDDFRRALKNGDGKVLKVEPRIVEEDEALQPRIDGNTVDVDLEMAQLAKNSLLYRTFIQIVSQRISMMRAAIAGR